MAYLYLVLAIAAETIGTTALQASRQFTQPVPSAIVVVAYGLAFYLLSLTLRTIPVGIAYALWSGLGVIFIAAIARAVFGQRLDLPAMAGIALIIAGIAVIQLFSESARH